MRRVAERCSASRVVRPVRLRLTSLQGNYGNASLIDTQPGVGAGAATPRGDGAGGAEQ